MSEVPGGSDYGSACFRCHSWWPLHMSVNLCVHIYLRLTSRNLERLSGGCFWLYCPCREVGQGETPETGWASFCAPAVRCPQCGFSALLAVLPAQTLRPGPAELHEAPCLLAASVQLPGFCSVWCPWSMASVKKAYSTWDLALHRP